MGNTFPLEAYILQKEQTGLEKPLYQPLNGRRGGVRKYDYPQTVVIHNPEIFYGFSKPEILQRSREAALVHGVSTVYWGMLTENGIQRTPEIHYTRNRDLIMLGLEVPESVASYYSLVEGDKVEIDLDKDNNSIYFSSVNGCNRPEIFRKWPRDLSGFQSDYPKKPLPVEKYGDFELRVISLLSPDGLGEGKWLIAPGGAGKTWILVKYLKACLQLTKEIENLYIIMVYVGDRPEDAALYIDVIKSFEGAPAEIYSAAWNTRPDTQVDTVRFAMKRAQRLTAIGYHVVVLTDSISRTVAAHTASQYVDKNSGMIGGGIYRDSLTEMIALQYGTHGSYGEDQSLSIIGTVLAAAETKKTSESAVDQETSDSSTTSICRLLKIPTLPRPWISVNKGDTNTRIPKGKDFRSEEQKNEMEKVETLMRAGLGSRSSEEAHRVLLQYARDNPFPKY